METAANRKTGDAFRNFAEPARDSVREFYRQNHAQPTGKVSPTTAHCGSP